MAELSEKLIQRVIPHSQEAEQSVIGSMLRDKEAVAAATELLSEEDFYQRQYAILFRVMRELYNEAKPVDLVTVQEKLRGKDIPPELSEIAFLKEVMQSVATSVNVRSYCSIVKEKSVLRALIRANEEIAELCYSGGEELEEVLSIAEKKIFDLLQKRSAREFTPIEDVAMTVLHNIEKASRQKDPIIGVPTGFLDLDYRTAGLQPSDLILVAARPSMGKTAFVLNILDYVGVRKNMPAMVFSLEMSKEQLVNRMLSLETLIDADKLRKGTLTDEDWATLIEGIDRVVASNIIIDDTPGISVSELRSKCRKAKLERGLSLIMIDYLQLMTGSAGKRAENRQQEITEISRSLKALAREMNCPVIALSQLSRACEQRPDHRPMLSDLRDSGAIEQDADIVMFLYRDDYYNKDTEHPNEAEIIIAKQRNGPIGTVTLLWQPEYTRFVNAERGS